MLQESISSWSLYELKLLLNKNIFGIWWPLFRGHKAQQQRPWCFITLKDYKNNLLKGVIYCTEAARVCVYRVSGVCVYRVSGVPTYRVLEWCWRWQRAIGAHSILSIDVELGLQAQKNIHVKITPLFFRWGLIKSKLACVYTLSM